MQSGTGLGTARPPGLSRVHPGSTTAPTRGEARRKQTTRRRA